MKEKIIHTAIGLLQNQGISFTMDDIAAAAKISKKTIYKYFDSKETLFMTVVDYLFDDIHRQQVRILHEALPNVEKLRRIVCVYPEAVRLDAIDLEGLLTRHPEIYERIDFQFHTNWELTLSLYDQCVAEGSLKPIDRNIFKLILLGIFDQTIHTEHQEQVTRDCIDAVFSGFLA